MRAHNRAVAEGGELRLMVPASALVLRMFAYSGLDQVIPNFPGLGEALQPAPATPKTHTRPVTPLGGTWPTRRIRVVAQGVSTALLTEREIPKGVLFPGCEFGGFVPWQRVRPDGCLGKLGIRLER
jgi:hypothetical protein